MRFKFFSWVFLCVTLLSGLSMQSAQASPQEDQKTYNVSISLKDATVKGVADALTKQTGILFSYDADLNSMSLGEVKVSHKNSSLTSILDEVFANPVIVAASIKPLLSDSFITFGTASSEFIAYSRLKELYPRISTFSQ